MAHLLHEFLLEVRYRWESGHLLPGLPKGSPDPAYCLFHQKLQMINCCIERKHARENKNEQEANTIEPETDEASDSGNFISKCCDKMSLLSELSTFFAN